MNRHEDMQNTIRRYVAGLLEECGEKNPHRRKAYETDVGYALEVITPFVKRFEESGHYDIYAVDGDFKKALRLLHDAADVLERFGVKTTLPAVIENPRKIIAECVMALVDTLRSLDAFWAQGCERFIGEVIDERFVPGQAGSSGFGGSDAMINTFVSRYVRSEIPEKVLDEIACEEGRLEEYLEGLKVKGGGLKARI